jgi:hypothetical protein
MSDQQREGLEALLVFSVVLLVLVIITGFVVTAF